MFKNSYFKGKALASDVNINLVLGKQKSSKSYKNRQWFQKAHYAMKPVQTVGIYDFDIQQ